MLVFPNYKKCSVNIISSLKKFYRINTAVPSLEVLDKELNRNFENVVLFVLEGVGENMLKDCLRPSDILVRSMAEQLTAVCPACPAAANVSALTGLCPSQHGRLGQTMFFKELCRTVELTTNQDPYSEQSVSITNAADFILPYENVFGDIAESMIGSVQPFSIAMPGVKIAENKSYHKIIDHPKKMFELIKRIAESDQNTFTYVQWGAAAEEAMKHGCGSERVKTILRDINDTVEGLSETLTDTLFIVTSSYGLTGISAEIMLNLRYELCDCLIMPPSFGNRAVNFFVKADKRSDFERVFAEELAEDFYLMSRSEALRKEIFGTGKANRKINDFIGDYCAFAISDKSLRFRALNQKHRVAVKAGFGGITSDEMCLPLCMIATKQTAAKKRPFTENLTPKSFGNTGKE